MRRRQADRSDTTRRAIIDAARALLTEQGYEHTRIEQIAERAGMSKGALYHHYRDKADVLAAVYEHLCREMTERLLLSVEPGADPLDSLATGLRLFLQVASDPEYRQIALIDAPAGLGWERWRQIDAAGGGFGLLLTALKAAAAADLIAPDHLEDRAHLFMAAVSEAALLIARSPHPDKSRTVMADLLVEQLDALRLKR